MGAGAFGYMWCAMISSDEADRVRASFEPLKPVAAKGAETFFDNLLEAYPHLEGPFMVAGKKPGSMLWATIGLISENAGDLGSLELPMRNLGERHGAFGAKAEDYGRFADILIGTIAAANADSWDDATETAWEKVLGQIVDFMSEGAAKAAAAA